MPETFTTSATTRDVAVVPDANIEYRSLPPLGPPLSVRLVPVTRRPEGQGKKITGDL